MADLRSIREAIRATKPMDLVNHPFTFALGVGLANGGLAAVRGKHIDLPTALALAAILGIGESVINAFEPGEKKYSNLRVAIYSVAGVGLGLAPFVRLHVEESGSQVAVAQAEKRAGEAAA